MVSCKWHFMLLCTNRSCDLPTNTCLGSCCYLSLIKLVWQFLMRDGNINEVQLNDSVSIALTLSGRWLNADGFLAHSLVQATGKLRMVVFPTVCSVSFRRCLD